MRKWSQCPTCKGLGVVDGETCPECEGKLGIEVVTVVEPEAEVADT